MKKYIVPEMAIIVLKNDDVLTASPNENDLIFGADEFSWVK